MKSDKGKSSYGAAPGLTIEDQRKAEEILERLRVSTGASNDASLAEALGLGVSSMSPARSRGMIPPSWIVTAAIRHGLSADFLIFGKAPENPPTKVARPPASARPFSETFAGETEPKSGLGLFEASGTKEAPGGSGEKASPPVGEAPGKAAPFSEPRPYPGAGPRREPAPGYATPLEPGPSQNRKAWFEGGGEEAFSFERVSPQRRGVTESELELMPEANFLELWESFRTRSQARRGWVRMETIGRFPEFLKWLKS
jgi:hypothetical protein